jgi:hypothetical protein
MQALTLGVRRGCVLLETRDKKIEYSAKEKQQLLTRIDEGWCGLLSDDHSIVDDRPAV